MTIPRWISVSFVGLALFLVWVAAFTPVKGGAAGLAYFAAIALVAVIAAILFWNLEG